MCKKREREEELSLMKKRRHDRSSPPLREHVQYAKMNSISLLQRKIVRAKKKREREGETSLAAFLFKKKCKVRRFENRLRFDSPPLVLFSRGTNFHLIIFQKVE